MINKGKGSMAKGFGGTPARGPRGMGSEINESKESREAAAFRANEVYQAQRKARLEKQAQRTRRM